MVKLLIPIFILVFTLTPQTNAAPKNFSFFAGTGVGFGWPEVFRFGWKDVEVGEYTTSLSVVKNFQKNDLYLGFGAGLNRQGSLDLGVTGSAGWEKYWKFIGLRLDWSTFAAVNSYMCTEVTLGISLNF